MSALLTLFLAALAVPSCHARFTLQQQGYLRLPGRDGEYRINNGAAEEGAYDPVSDVVYVIGEGSNTLQVVDVATMQTLRVLYTHHFQHVDGIARDVEVCGKTVAVALSSEIDVFPGHVQIFAAYNRTTNSMPFEHRVTVGEFPDNLKFTPDCKQILVANEGRSGFDHTSVFINPPGTLTLITLPTTPTSNPSEREIDFVPFETRADLRSIYRTIPSDVLNEHGTIPQALKPEYVAVPDANYGYVTFQDNNALGRVNLKTGAVDMMVNLPQKEWQNLGIDASDHDGGIHLNTYPIKSFRQPDTIKALTVSRKTYLFTADEGNIQSFRPATHGFTWNEGARAGVLLAAEKFDRLGINNETLFGALGTDSQLGRLMVSQVDGINPFSGLINDVHAFGGRGFSIYDAADLHLVRDSGDELERRARTDYPVVFNTQLADPATQSPENLKDTVSDDMGPKPNALDVKLLPDGTGLLAIGSETTGIIYLYSLTFSSTTVTNVTFEDSFRRGSTDFLWNELYDTNTAGDAGIADIGLIRSSEHPSNSTLLYVISSQTGSISLYRIVDSQNPSG